MTINPSRLKNVLPYTLLGTSLCLSLPVLRATAYQQDNLVSDVPNLASHLDAHLVNPWGIAESSTSPFWIANTATGTSTLYNTGGTPQALVVTIPPPGGGPSAPIGIVFNSSTSFNGDAFIFASARGTITGWRGAPGTTAEPLAAVPGAVYLGLAIGSVGSSTYLYAANFAGNSIDVFKDNGTLTSLAGTFVDPSLPTSYRPFNVENIGNNLFVTYALLGPDGQDDAGAGHGFVDKFDLSGNFVARFASNGVLNSPWGLALAPSSFGEFGGDLLVGNFGDGTINAFNTAGVLQGTLKDDNGNPLINEGLWALQFGNGGNGGGRDSLYFTAGIDDENHGLFGSITPVPEPATTGVVGALSLVGLCTVARLRRKKATPSPAEPTLPLKS